MSDVGEQKLNKQQSINFNWLMYCSMFWVKAYFVNSGKMTEFGHCHIEFGFWELLKNVRKLEPIHVQTRD